MNDWNLLGINGIFNIHKRSRARARSPRKRWSKEQTQTQRATRLIKICTQEMPIHALWRNTYEWMNGICERRSLSNSFACFKNEHTRPILAQSLYAGKISIIFIRRRRQQSTSENITMCSKRKRRRFYQFYLQRTNCRSDNGNLNWK